MEKTKISYKTLFVVCFIMLVLLSLSSFIFITGVNSSIHKRAEDLVYNSNENVSNYIDSIISTYYDEVDNTIKDYQSNSKIGEQNDELLVQLYEKYGNKTTNSFVGFGYYTTRDDVVFYDGKSNNVSFLESSLSAERHQNQKVSFVNLSNLFSEYDDDSTTICSMFNYKLSYSDETSSNNEIVIFALQDFSSSLTMFNNAYASYKAKSMYIMTCDGAIYLSNDENQKGSTFYYLLKDENTEDKIDTFIHQVRDNGSSMQRYTYNGENRYFAASSMLSDYNEYSLVFMSYVDDASVNTMYKNLLATAIVYAICASVVLLIGFICLYIILFTKFSQYKINKYSYASSKVIALLASHRGKILICNKRFKEINDKKYHNIFDFDIQNEQENFKTLINKKSSVVCKFIDKNSKERYVKFVIVRNKSRYQLLGDFESNTFEKLENLERLAYHDHLTNYYNRLYLEGRLQEIISSTDNLATPKSLIIIDIIEFKNINKLFGVGFGDDVILYLIKKVDELKQPEDEIFSLEAEKVALLVDTPKEYGMMFEKCKAIYDELVVPVTISMNEIDLEIAIGVFDINLKQYINLKPEAIMRNAMLANEKARANEDRKIYIYDKGLNQLIEREAMITNDLKNAVKNNEFTLYYQPQYDLNTNKVTGFEALLRWKNPKYIKESPFEYIRIAERTGLIVHIGDFILDESFRVAKKLYQEGKTAHISINFSTAQILQTGFVDKFLSYYQKYEIPYSAISAEITETLLITSFSDVANKLKQIRSKGIEVYLDDFGMGYSSLLYLNDLPVDYIKIDREFIKYLQHNRNSRVIVARILDMANDLNIEIVAEGVENQYQVDYLLKNKCHLIQGWIVDKAQPEEKIDEMLNFNKILNAKAVKNDVKEDNSEAINYDFLAKKKKNV